MKVTGDKNRAWLIYFIIFLIPFLCITIKARATHIVGATLNYEYVSGNKYRLSVLLYRDCRTQTPPIPVAAPNDVKINVRRSDGKTFRVTIKKTSVRVLPVPLPDDPCAQPPSVAVCVEEYLYTAVFDNFESGFDHYLYFSLCCRNSTITNLAPEQQTETIYTKIPDRAVTANLGNAKFVNPPPSYVCGGKQVTIPHLATDADGDNLKYSLYTPNAGPSNQIQSDTYIPTVTNGFPNFVPVTYSTVNGVKFNGLSPMNAKETIDSTNGDLTFTATTYGQFVIGVKVKEFRGSDLISETLRDYQFNIVRCPPPAKAALVLNDICNSLRVTPSNSGGDDTDTRFFWNFGEASKAPKDTSYKRNPSYTYSKAGTYTIKLIVNPNSKCADSTTTTIRVSQLKAAFTSSGDTCAGFDVNFADKSTSSSNTPITNVNWNFADGVVINTPTALQTQKHAFSQGGSYNIRMIVTNSIGCKDSVVNVVKIIQGTPKAVAGSDITLCKNNPTAQLNGVVNNAGGGIWKGGAGTFNPGNTTLKAKYTPTSPELNAGFVNLKLVTTKNGKCGGDSTTVKLIFTDSPTITAGVFPYAPICGNNPVLDLNGKVLPDKKGYGIKWTGSGGTFKTEDNSDPITNPLSIYIVSAGELAAGKVTLTIESTNNGNCLPAKDATTININPPPVINAGNDTIVCVNAADVNLHGTLSVGTKIVWSTNSGDGTFVGGNSNLKTIYRPGTNDKQKGIVEVVLATNEVPGFATYPQNCKQVKDTMYIKIIPAAIVSAGSDQTVCSNNPNVKLTGSVTFQTGTGKGDWTGGNGSFNPGRSSLNATYTPTAAEIAAKSVKLFLVSNNPDKCLDVTDTVNITFSPSPVVNPGTPGVFCKNNPAIQLNGSVTLGASTGTWTAGGGTFSPNANFLNAVYTPTAAEVSSGSVKFTLKSTSNNKCLAVSGTVTHTFNDLPVIDAGSPVIACKNNSKIKLNAALIQGAKGVKWTGGAGIFTPSDTVLSPAYQPTAAEANAGKIIFTATSTGNGNCNPVSDTVSATFINSPTVNPGTAAAVCANNSKISLNGSTSTGTGIWSTATGGKFVPGATDLITAYLPSKTDSLNGLVLFTLTSAGNGLCQAVSANLQISINPAPFVSAGPQQTLCANNPDIKLNGSVSGGASTGIWSGGTNSILGGNTNLSGTYKPSPQEIAKGKVLLTLSSTGNTGNTCVAVSDTVTFYFSPSPVINAGGDKTVCGDLVPVSINATASSQVTSLVWTTDGSGTFTNANSLNTTYKPTTQDQDKNSVKLTLTTTAQGNCKPVDQSLNIVFSLKPAVNAGPDHAYCTTDSLAQLAATGSAGNWSSTTGGSFSPSASVQNARYKPSAADIANKSVILTFTSDVSGPCNSVSDKVTIQIIEGPKTTFTAPPTICSDQLISLSAPNTPGVRVRWTSTGSGNFSPSDTSHTATYKPSQTEIKNGNAELSIEAISALCGNASKDFSVKVLPKFDVSAGGDQQYCADIKSIPLSGTRTGTFPVKWTSTGTGTFAPDNSSLKTSYIPSPADLASPKFNLTLSSNGLECPNTSNDIEISIISAPKIEAGSDIVICNDTSHVVLTGTILNRATGGFWTTNAGGTISPNSLTAQYSPKTGEKGVFKFYFTSTGNDICNAVKDSIKVTINDKPSIDALSGTKVCADEDTILLSVTAKNSSGIQWSKLQAGGTIKDDKDSTTFYILSASDRSSGFVSFKVKTIQGADKCKSVDDQVVFDITPAPVVSAGGNLSYCANASSIPLTATVTGATSVLWKSTGNGTFANASAFSTSYKPGPLDITNGKVDIILTALATNICKAKSDTITITLTPEPAVTVPDDFEVCADSSFIQLTAGSSTGSGNWTSDGGNNFSPNSSSLAVKFVPSAGDIAKGKVVFTFSSKNNISCAPVSKNVTVTITPAPTISAGTDQQICADLTTLNLAGTVTVASGVKWTSSGTGKFTSTNSASGTSIADGYLLSVIDTIAKQVTFTVTTTNSGKCKPVSDKMTVKIIPAPFIDAGPKTTTQCGDKASIDLSGKFGNARNGKWSSDGKGKFAPNDSSRVSSYLITSEDSLKGKVNIVYTTVGTGKCKVYSDTLKLTILPAPKISVIGGSSREICADKDTIHLAGMKVAAQGVLWSSSGKGTVSPRKDTTHIVYKLTQEDKKAGRIRFLIAATGIGTCNKISDSIIVSIAPAPTVDAGKSEEFCASINEIDLTGSITVASEGVWKTSGSGTFSDSTDLFGKYIPSQSDKLLKSVELTLSSKNNGLCKAVSGKVTFKFTPIPEVTIGTDQTLCKDVEKVVLNGSFKNAQGASWIPVGGNGTFSPDNSQSITSYIFDSTDVLSSNMVFNYTTFGNGVCDPVTKSLNVKFLPVPVVDAGPASGICSDAPSITLNGTVQNAGGGEWKTLGTGSLVSSGQGLQATYIPSPADLAGIPAQVKFYLTSKNNNGCKAYKDSVVVSITAAPVITSIPSHTICADSAGIQIIPLLAGTVNTISWSTASGTGNFLPSNTSQNVTFKPSQTQINNGKATVTLVVTGGGVCASSQAKSTSAITITQAPTLSLSDVSICQGSVTVDLNAVQNNNIATAFKWTSLSVAPGSFTSPNALATTYNTSLTEQALINDEVKIQFETVSQGLCKPFKDTITVRFVPTPPVDAGTDQTICTNVDSVRLNAAGSAGSWTKIGTGASGTFKPNAFALSASYFPSQDDKDNNKVSLVFTSIPGGTCTAKSDTIDVTINEGPTFNPGSDRPTCANSGAISINAQNSPGSTVAWITDGTGIFGDSLNSITTYTPSATDIAAENISIKVKVLDAAKICKPEYKKFNLTITPAPEVFSGSDFDVCGNAPSIAVAGKVTKASVGSGKWTVLSPSPGKFQSSNASETTLLNDNYLPSAQEKSASMATLLFTSNNNGTCIPVSDTLKINFTTSPTVEAGSPLVPVCGDTAYIPLNGSVTIVNGGQWSHNGLGSFTDTNQVLTRYVPNDDERANGAKIKFILTSYQLGTCISEKDSFEIDIKPRPVLNPGLETTVCGDTAFVSLNGTIANAGGGLWSVQKGTGLFDSNKGSATTLLTDKYIPSANDIASGQVLLMLTTTGNGNCKPLSDFKKIILTPTPAVNAGSDFSVCANNRLLDLEASILRVATGVKWSTTGNGTFLTKADSTVTTYRPSVQDSAAKAVTFFLISSGNGACKPSKDTLIVKLTDVPVVSVNSIQNICADSNSVLLSGNVSGGATSGLWSSNGTGSISDPSSFSTEYNVSEQDKTTGNVTFTLFSDDNGNCIPVSKTVRLDIDPRPLIFAGNDTTVCSDTKLVRLHGTKNAIVTATRWSTTSTPDFRTPVTGLDADYAPAAEDVKKGAILFIFESTAQGLCKPVKDVKVLNFQEAPVVTVNAGLPKTVCASNSVLELNGKVLNANRSVWSSLTALSGNRGEFEDSMKVNTVYQPSAFELGNGKDSSKVTLRLTGYNTIGQCTRGASSDVVITILPAPFIEFNSPVDTVSVCADKDTVFVSAVAKVAGKIVPGFWASSGNGVFESNAFITNPVYRFSQDDRKRGHIALIFKSDGNIGCDTVSKVKIIKLIPAVPTADAGPDQEICKNNANFSLNGQITTATNSGWHASAAVSKILPDSNMLQVVVVPSQNNLNAGAVKMKLRTHGPGSCKDVIDEMFVNFIESPVVNIPAASLEMCADADSIQLSASVKFAEGAVWSTSGTGSFLPAITAVNARYVPSAIDKVKGSVKLKLTSTGIKNCLPVSDSIDLTIRVIPTVSGSAEDICVTQKGLKLLASSSTGAGEWTSSGTGSFAPNSKDPKAKYFPGFEDFNSGQVQLKFSSLDNKTCQPVSQSVAVNVSPVPVADAGKDQKICIGTTTQISALPKNDIIKYSWFQLPGNASLNNDLVFTTAILNANTAFKLEVTDNKGCRNADSVSVSVMAKPELEYTTPYCALSLIKPKKVSNDTINGVFQWFRDEDILPSNNRSSIIPDRKGGYSNTFSIYNCSVTASTEVKPVPVLSGLNKIICQNTQTTVEMNFVPENSGYDWSFRAFGKPGITLLADHTNKQNVSVGKDTLVYYALVKDSVFCTTRDSIIVYPVPSPVHAKLTDTTLCGGASFALDGTPLNFTSPRINYLWVPNGETTALKTITAPVNSLKSDTTHYILSVAVGECVSKDTATIIVNPNPNPGFPDFQVFCSDGDPSLPIPGVTLDAGSVGTYLWNTGETSRTINVKEEGKYKITVVNKFKCTGSDSVNLVEKCQPAVFRPQAFTPNGDGKNDVFRVFGNKFVKNFKLLIFNRWGEVIFKLEDIPGNSVFETGNKVYSWDGTYLGEEMPMGSYPYIITYEGKEEEFKGPYQLNGSITLIR